MAFRFRCEKEAINDDGYECVRAAIYEVSEEDGREVAIITNIAKFELEEDADSWLQSYGIKVPPKIGETLDFENSEPFLNYEPFTLVGKLRPGPAS